MFLVRHRTSEVGWTQRLSICNMVKALNPVEQFLTPFRLAVLRILHFNPVTRRLLRELVRASPSACRQFLRGPSARFAQTAIDRHSRHGQDKRSEDHTSELQSLR